MKDEPPPPYDENKRIILETTYWMVEAMRQLKNGVAHDDPVLIRRGIMLVKLQLRGYRSLAHSISQEIQSIEGKQPVRSPAKRDPSE